VYGEAQDETRTRDPILTMDVLYQLSYLGESSAPRSDSDERQDESKASPDSPSALRGRYVNFDVSKRQ
jgi:hypothetical protein